MPLLTSHPSRTALYEYAEQLERKVGRVSERVEAHVHSCAQCEAEVARTRATIALSTRAAELEPSREVRARIFLSARQERKRSPRGAGILERYSHRRAAALASSVVVLAALSIVSVRYASATDAPSEFQSSAQSSGISIDALRQASPEEKLLAPAVLAQSQASTPWEASQRRALSAWDAEIDEALAALESNPACVRAAALVNANRERLGETLKVLYVEGSL